MWFDPLTAWLGLIFNAGIPLAKEKIEQIGQTSTSPIPTENWENKELIAKDKERGMSEQEILRNARQGRYIIRLKYPIPHREKTGNKRIVIENCELHKEDIRRYGAYQAYKWSEQGKYNLNLEELEITNLQYEKSHLKLITLSSSFNCDKEKRRIEEINQIIATKNWDCRNTEAVKQWQRAHDANNLEL